MPKIRGVKPDYWTDEDIVDLSIPARLLFIGLWTYACDNGHLQDKSKQIKMRVMPGDDVNVAELLRELESAGRIRRNQGYITIPNFARHQRPDRRYFQTCDLKECLKPGDSQPETRGGHHETTAGARSGLDVGSMGPHVDGDVRGSDGDGDGEGRPAGKPAKRATQLPQDFEPNEHHQSLAAGTGVDLNRELAKFRDHHTAKGTTFKDWNAAFNNWLRKAAEYGGNVRPLQRPATDDQGRTVLPPLPSRSPWGPS